MDYVVTVDFEQPFPIDTPYTDDDAHRLADLGGACSLSPERISTTVTVTSTDPADAVSAALDVIHPLVGHRGRAVAIEVLTTAEQDRQLASPPPRYWPFTRRPYWVMDAQDPVAVLVHPDDWERLHDTLDEQAAHLALLRATGDTIPLADLTRELDLEP